MKPFLIHSSSQVSQSRNPITESQKVETDWLTLKNELHCVVIVSQEKKFDTICMQITDQTVEWSKLWWWWSEIVIKLLHKLHVVKKQKSSLIQMTCCVFSARDCNAKSLHLENSRSKCWDYRFDCHFTRHVSSQLHHITRMFSYNLYCLII